MREGRRGDSGSVETVMVKGRKVKDHVRQLRFMGQTDELIATNFVYNPNRKRKSKFTHTTVDAHSYIPKSCMTIICLHLPPFHAHIDFRCFYVWSQHFYSGPEKTHFN